MKAVVAVVVLLLVLAAQDEKEIKDKHTEIMAYVKGAKSEREFRAATSDLEKLGAKAFASNRFDLAGRIWGDADRIARTALKDLPLAQAFQDSAKRAAEVGKEYARASRALLNILRNEGTPEDFTQSGRFLCFVKGDWELGLADLARGKDEGFKKIAEADAAGVNPMEIADGWFALLKKEPGVRERALYWYAKAWPTLSGIQREKTRERVAKMRPTVTPGKPVVPPPGWGGPVDTGHKIEGATTCVHSGGGAARLIPSKAPRNASFLRSGDIPVGNAGKLAFSAWALSDGTNKSDGIRFTVKDATGQSISGVTLTIPTDTPFWTQLEKEVEVASDGALASVEVVVFSNEGSVWIDDISLKIDGRELVRGGSFENP
jgi:hypothetical protein